MTLEELLDREGIFRTIHKYTMSGDDYDEDSYITCFTDDAVLEFDPFPGKGHVRLEGRQAIYEFVTGFFTPMKRSAVTMPGGALRHHITCSEIDLVDSETANARNYCLVANREGVQASGVYTGKFRKRGDEWLISYRKWTADQ